MTGLVARSATWAVVVVACLVIACGDDDVLPVAELMDPATCMACHPKHTQEWASSMHAYAADDPVFLALNRQGQEQTGGALGDFCVRCHAPMALALGLTTDGLNLAEVPQYAKGVTCYFCHNAVEITDDHNAPIRIANDQTMRAGVRNPITSPAHHTGYATIQDATQGPSASLCGSCHDIVTLAGVHLERTFAEWKTTIFASTDPRKQLTCPACHMVATTDVIAEGPGFTAPLREFGRREHTFAGIDKALTVWPGKAEQQQAIDRDLAAVLVGRLCVLPVDGGRIDYRLDNVGGGHMFPSGASADRRAWIEIVAYGTGDSVLWSSGVIPAATPLADPEAAGDPLLWRLDTKTVDAAGLRTERFWNVAAIDHPGSLLPPAVTTDASDPRFYHAVEKSFPVPGLLPQITRVTARVLIRPLPIALLTDLMATGHLPIDVRSEVPTHEVASSVLQWTAATSAAGCVQ
jgi:Cytochrome c554 and c-prime